MKQLLCLFSILLLASVAHAWETQVDGAGPNPWRSLYQLDPPEPIRGLVRPREMTDEHTRLSDLALDRLGVADLFARGGSAEMSIIDLNASLFRRELLDGLPTIGDNEETALEERYIPPPAHFSGVPDYSFTIYDWLNKNQLCPPGPSVDRCHEYMFGWLGNLNSTHFGSQATGMYRHYHSVAAAYAARARALHLAARIAGNGEHEAYIDHIKEAELEALAYEAYAQHFLQDRWAIGHMWERWNGPDMTQIPTQDNLENTLVSAVAGLMHGSESVLAGNHTVHLPEEFRAYLNEFTGVDLGSDSFSVSLGNVLLAADPMSSPIIRDGKVYPLRWRHESQPDRNPIPGVGDDRLFDIQRKKFGAGYGSFNFQTMAYENLDDAHLMVDYQFDRMLTCSAAGYAAIIKAFGKFDGAYGAWKAPLSADAPEFDVITQDTCWDMWATNEAMLEGFSNSGTLSANRLGRMIYGLDVDRQILTFLAQRSGSDALNDIPNLPRHAILQVLAELEVAAQDDPFGTKMARGYMGPFDKFDSGDLYTLPSYAHPEQLKDLSEDSEIGLDRKTLSGAFSRSHSDYWCENMGSTLFQLRAQTEPHKNEACEYLAGFAYGGTDADYAGELREKLLFQGKEIKSVCALRGFADENGQLVPSRLMPGYVNAKLGAQAPSPSGYGLQSVAHWCAKVPVLRLSETPDLRDQNIVAEIDVDDLLVLTGLDLGVVPGRVLAISDEETVDLGQALEWSEIRISFELNDKLQPDTLYTLEVRRGTDNAESVGLFRLRTLEKNESPPVTPEQLVGVGPCRIPLDPEVLPNPEFLAFFESWRGLDSPSIAEYIPRAAEFFQQAAELLTREADCIDALLVENLLPHFDPGPSESGRFDPSDGIPRFLIEAEYLAIDVDGHRVGEEQYFNEKSTFSHGMHVIHSVLYRKHAGALRHSAQRFVTEIEYMQQAVADLETLEQKLLDTGDEAIAAQLNFHKATLWENFLPVHQAAPLYMSYVSTGLNRWAVAEERLMTLTLPGMIELAAGRLAKLKGAWSSPCGLRTSITYPIHNGPTDIAAGTPHFMSFEAMAIQTELSEIIFAEYDRHPMRWETPKLLVDIIGWQFAPGYENPTQPPSALIGCPHFDAFYAATNANTNFEAVYGEQMGALFGNSPQYETRASSIGKFLPTGETEVTCLRCDLLKKATDHYGFRLDHINFNQDTRPTSSQHAGSMGKTLKSAIPHIEARLAALRQEHSQCLNICTPVAFAPLVGNAAQSGMD